MNDVSSLELQIDDIVSLKLLEVSDASELFQTVDANRNYLRQWLPWLDINLTVEDSRKFILYSHQRYLLREALVFGLRYNGSIGGVISYHRIDWSTLTGEIGYWLAEHLQGRGLMTRACQQLIKYGFETLKLDKIEIRCAEKNIKSRAIPLRLGFRETGFIKDAEVLYDNCVNHIIYSTTVGD